MLDGRIPVGHCARCKKDVLAVLWFDEHEEERRACAHCEAGLDPAELRWLTETELEAVGYAAYAEAEHCGRPDCGGGRGGRGG